MLQRTNKILIGKDIDRTANVTTATSMSTVVQNIVAGEIVVLDKNKLPLAAGSTIADSDVIYICQGTSKTFDFTNEAGTPVTGARQVIFSDPIEAGKVKSYKAKPFTVKSEQTDSWVLGSTVTAGVEYIVRIVYNDLPEHPGQFTHTYRVIAQAGDDVDDLGADLAAEINKHSGRRVNATYTGGTNTLLLTARENPNGTTSLNDIDEFSMVEFESFINYVDSNGNWQSQGATLNRTAAVYGYGNWEQIRDAEKAQLGYMGVYNLTHFPVITPDFSTALDSYYDTIVIEHDKSYLSADNQYVKEAPLTTIIALATASTGVNANGQAANILAVLNPWFASCPGGFSNVSI